jgi:hypothetical protein
MPVWQVSTPQVQALQNSRSYALVSELVRCIVAGRSLKEVRPISYTSNPRSPRPAKAENRVMAPGPLGIGLSTKGSPLDHKLPKPIETKPARAGLAATEANAAAQLPCRRMKLPGPRREVLFSERPSLGRSRCLQGVCIDESSTPLTSLRPTAHGMKEASHDNSTASLTQVYSREAELAIGSRCRWLEPFSADTRSEMGVTINEESESESESERGHATMVVRARDHRLNRALENWLNLPEGHLQWLPIGRLTAWTARTAWFR